MRFFHTNLADAATLTASTETDGYAVENLQHSFLQKQWRSGTSIAAESITADLGSSQEVSAVILAAHDIAIGDEVTFELSDLDDFSDTEPQPFEWRAGTMLAVFPAVQVRYVRVNITKSAAGNAVSVGRLFIGPHYQCAEDPEHDGYEVAHTDLSKSARSIGGQVYSEIRNGYRTFKIPFEMIPGEQAEEFFSMGETLGTHTPLFFQVQDSLADLNSDVQDEIVYARFRDVPKRANKGTDGSLLWSMSLTFNEDI